FFHCSWILAVRAVRLLAWICLSFKKTSTMERDGNLTSLWQATANEVPQEVASLPAGIVDVVVVGAGITGLSTGLELVKAGKSCVVVEAKNIGFGTTGGTSAHINTILDLPYDRMISKLGEEDSRIVGRGTLKAWARS